jgi:tRNA(Ile)-lysidine synthase
VARVLERITATARDHEMFAPGDLVMVMVSGGPDSTCLLYSLHLLRRLFKIRLAVVHVDHRLRPDSAKDAAYVRRTCERLRVPFVLRTAAGGPSKGESPEAWARAIRYAAALDAAHEAGADRVATGHTLDDQAETVLIALIRGATPFGLAGMPPVSRTRTVGDLPPVRGVRVRPLIDVRRAEVEAFCRSLGLRPRLDSTNADTRFLRNALRLEGIPALERATGRDVRGPIARSADLLRRHLEEFGTPLPPDLVSASAARKTDDGWLLYPTLLEDTGLRGRLIAHVLRSQGADVTEASVDAVVDLWKGRPGRRRDLGGGLIAVRHKEYIRVTRTSPNGS